jgi:ABC-type transport system involved in cytochrome c biogenesis ATPase subunit
VAIQRVKLEYFRGATQPVELHFDAAKNLVIIFGENGTGKSTIVDAIDLVCNRSAGSIGEISSASVREHLHSLGATQAQLRVEVECDGAICTGRASGRNVVVPAAPPPPAAQILRRSKLHSLVMASPSERFAQLKRLIDIEGVLKSEDNLSKTINELRQKVNENTRTLSEAQQQLQEAFQEEHTPEEIGLSPEEWAKRRVAVSSMDLEANAKALDALLVSWERAEPLKDAADASQAELDQARALHAKAEEELKALLTTLPQVVGEIVPVLNDTVVYLDAAPQTEECPVCERPIAPQDVRQRLVDRLKPLEALDAQQKATKKAADEVARLYKSTATGYSNLRDQLRGFLDQWANASDAVQAVAPLSLEDYAHLRADEPKLTRPIINECYALMAFLGPRKAAAIELRDRWQKQANQLGSIRRALETVKRVRANAERLQNTLQQLELMLEVVRSTRIAFTNNVLDAIADDCDRLYQSIHPKEGIGAVRFQLDQERRGSLHQTGTFAGREGIAPQGYFSESHLDTLGFCFFLALARYTAGRGCVIVLDDVFASVDLHHIQRILHLLLEEAEHFGQIILTTHQRRWPESVKTHQVSRANVQLLELHLWDIQNGVSCADVLTHVEALRAAVADRAAQREALAIASGRAIEMAIGTMARVLGGSVHLNPADRYTATEFLNAMKKPARHLKFRRNGVELPESTTRLQELLETLTTSVIITRNTLGAHFNWEGCDIDERTVRQFAQETLEVVDLFLCSECQCLPLRERGAQLLCGCGSSGVLMER